MERWMWFHFLIILRIFACISEIYVSYQCDDGYFGWHCKFQCQCATDGEVCNKTTGSCPSGCAGDNWGPGCLLDSSCYYDCCDNKQNGGLKYAGKISGKGTSTCNLWNDTSNQYKLKDDDVPEMNITLARNYCRNPERIPGGKPWCNSNGGFIYCDIDKCDCPDYRFDGQNNCDKDCRCRDSSEVCNKETGACTSGCSVGWGGTGCQDCTLGEKPSATSTATNITVSWNTTTCARSDVPGIQYVLEYAELPDDTWQTRDRSGEDCGIKCEVTISNLLPDMVYLVRVRIRKDDNQPGPFLEDETTQVKTLCGKPRRFHSSLFHVQEVSDSNRRVIRVTWNKITDQDWKCQDGREIKIRYKNGTDAGERTQTVAANARYKDFDTAACTNWSIQIKLVNTNDNSGFSRANTITTSTVVAQVTALTNGSITSTSANIHWRPPRFTGCNITGYSITAVRLQGECSQLSDLQTSPLLSETTTHYTLTKLYPNSQYDISIKAVSGAVEGDPRSLKIKTLEAAPSCPPGMVRFNNDTATFYWSEPSCECKNGRIIEYRYSLRPVTSKCQQESLVTKEGRVSDIYVPIIDLLPFTTYNFRVRAVTVDAGPWRDKEITTEGDLGQVQNLTTAVSGNTISVSWNPPIDIGCSITIYKITYHLKRQGTCQQRNGELIDSEASTEKTTYEIRELLPFSEYAINVLAVSKNVYGDRSSIMPQTLAVAPSCAPSSESKTADPRSVTMKWAELQCDCQNGPIIGYDYSIRPANDSDCVYGTIDNYTSSLSVTIHKLVPFTSYAFRVRAKNNQGDGPWSSEISVKTLEDVPPKITDIRTNSNTTAIEIQWKVPCPPHGVITRYEIKYKQKNANTFSAPINCDSCTDIYWIDIGLQADTDYVVKVSACTMSGCGENSDEYLVRTTEGIPEPPENLTLISATPTTLNVSWLEPWKRNGLIRNYQVSVFPVDLDKNRERVQEVLGDRFHFVIEGLRPSTQYEVQVRAKTYEYGEPVIQTFWTDLPSVTSEIMPMVSISKEAVTPTTVTLSLYPVKYEGPIKYYRVVVEKQSGPLRKRRDIVTFDESTLTGIDNASQKRDTKYIAIQLSYEELDPDSGKEVVVGDGKVYDGYRNPPLVQNQQYKIYTGFLAELPNGNQKSAYQEVQAIDLEGLGNAFTVKDYKSLSLGTAVGIAVAVVVLVFIGLAVFVIVWRRRRQKPKRDSHNIPLTKVHKEKNVYTKPGIPPKPDQAPLLIQNGNVSNPIRVQDLATFVQDAKNSGLLAEEYESLPSAQTASWDVAKKPENKKKNRYANIVAYDHSRVVLSQLPGNPHSDYINACHMDGYKKPSYFIAAQGAIETTLEDFWRMIWEKDVNTVVMVTNCVEDGRRKCEKYWPDTVQSYGMFTVQLEKAEELAEYTIRTFSLYLTENPKTTRTVTQFHFTSWPDHGVPTYATSVLQFHKRVKIFCAQMPGPVMVHCSAGVGRTGTFILLDIILDQAQEEKTVDILGQLMKMRQQRVNMIQTLDQYLFVYDAVVESAICGDTFIPTDRFSQAFNKLCKINAVTRTAGLEVEYGTLCKISPVLKIADCQDSQLPENSKKNRFPSIIPPDTSRPFLSPRVDGTNYINAVFVDGYRQRNAFIVTQMPLSHTVVDFWRMIWDHDSFSIVMLNEPDEDETCAVYWPADGSSISHGPFTIQHKSSQLVIDDSIRLITLQLSTYNKFKSEDVRTIRLFQFLSWPQGRYEPTNGLALIELLDQVERWQQKTGNKPVTVHCLDGSTKSGVYVTVSCVVDKVKLEQGVDVFHVVKNVRINRPQFIANIEQYDFCYTFAKLYLDSFENYSNFQIR